MGDYVIWLGEELSKRYPDKTWQELMEIITETPDFERKYGFNVQMYLAYLNRVRKIG